MCAFDVLCRYFVNNNIHYVRLGKACFHLFIENNLVALQVVRKIWYKGEKGNKSAVGDNVQVYTTAFTENKYLKFFFFILLHRRQTNADDRKTASFCTKIHIYVT